VTRRTFHRSGYTLHDSAGGPAAGPGEPPSPESAQAARHEHQEAVAAQRKLGGYGRTRAR
jgi:hypothetical protein